MAYIQRRKKTPDEKPKVTRPSKAMKTQVVLIVLLGMVGIGLLAWGFLEYMPVSLWPLIMFSYLIGAGLCWKYKQKLENREEDFLDGEITNVMLVAFSLSGAVITGILMVANGALDSGIGNDHQLAVVDKDVTVLSGGKAGQSPSEFYHVITESWDSSTTEESITVSESFYDSVKKGDYVEVKIMPGLLGMEWIADYKKMNLPEK